MVLSGSDAQHRQSRQVAEKVRVIGEKNLQDMGKGVDHSSGNRQPFTLVPESERQRIRDRESIPSVTAVDFELRNPFLLSSIPNAFLSFNPPHDV